MKTKIKAVDAKEEENKLLFIVVVGGLAIVVVGCIAQWLATNGYLS